MDCRGRRRRGAPCFRPAAKVFTTVTKARTAADARAESARSPSRRRRSVARSGDMLLRFPPASLIMKNSIVLVSRTHTISRHAENPPISAAVTGTGNSSVFRHSVPHTGLPYVLAECGSGCESGSNGRKSAAEFEGISGIAGSWGDRLNWPHRRSAPGGGSERLILVADSHGNGHNPFALTALDTLQFRAL
jgi:hypothetical protein